jgi:mono/diheme cytochrome c family protein
MKTCLWLMVIVLAAGVGGCKRDDMADQARGKPLGERLVFRDGGVSRLPPGHTVAVDGPLEEEDPSWEKGTAARRFPFDMTAAELRRGREHFDAICSPCHGLLGDGDGMIPERGFVRPSSFHTDRLRKVAPSYFFDVITKGIGAMFPYRDRVKIDDRWRIAAYIRALQLAQYAPADSELGTTQPATSAPAERGRP